jgi:hypothetical protein
MLHEPGSESRAHVLVRKRSRDAIDAEVERDAFENLLQRLTREAGLDVVAFIWVEKGPSRYEIYVIPYAVIVFL